MGMNEDKRSFLGTGWSFPPAFSDRQCTVQMVSEEADIRQSLYILFSTVPGERIMKPKYGCDLHSLVFDQLNSSTQSQITDMITMAVLWYEPRITIEQIQVELSAEDFGMIYIHLEYTVRKTNTRDNIVFPYYLREGTNIQGL